MSKRVLVVALAILCVSLLGACAKKTAEIAAAPEPTEVHEVIEGSESAEVPGVARATEPAEAPEATRAPELAIVGRWECQDTSQPHVWMCMLTFYGNGRFADRYGDSGSFSVDGRTLTLHTDGYVPVTFSFRITGDQLRLTGDGYGITLTRIGDAGETPDARPPNEAPEAARAPELALVGRWECRDTTIPHEWMCVLIFYENGRFADRDGDEGFFIIDGDSLTLRFDEFEPITFTFRILGDRLLIAGQYIAVTLERAHGTGSGVVSLGAAGMQRHNHRTHHVDCPFCYG